ncbi:TPA: hypothetical protein ACGR6T_004733, partial [Klebsiella aerogenes]
MENNITQEAFYILHQGFLDCIGNLPDNEPVSSQFTRIKINEDFIPVVIFNIYQEKIDNEKQDNPFSYNKKLKIFFDDKKNIFSVFLDSQEITLLSSKNIKECFDFCHSIQKRSVFSYLEEVINDYFDSKESSYYCFSDVERFIVAMIGICDSRHLLASYRKLILLRMENIYKDLLAKREK